MLRQSQWIVPMTLSVLILTGCGSDTPSQPTGQAAHDHQTKATSATTAPASASSSSTATPSAMKAFSDNGQVVEITISGDDYMKFDKDRFSVPKGAMVRLTLKHTGQSPAQSMGHNVVILALGDDPFEFGADVGEQGGNMANNYIPPKLRGRTIAYTTLIGGGQTTKVEFQAPEVAGEYPFLCSFPGHAGMMNGIMEVK